ncbi:MAG: DUF5671 domain-containing protein, partial [Actinomycetota bacterium]|nr:DUF5671 domain-containing protein [Actinomycetota bacterium]
TGLALFTKRRLDTDPAEQRSLGWAFYLTVALIGSLIATMSLTTAFLGEWLADGDLDRSLLIPALIWAGVWAGHWWVAQRRADPDRMQLHLLLGSAAGLVTVVIGAGVGLGAALGEIYDGAFSTSVVDSGLDALVRAAVILVVGTPVWWWYWLRHARTSARKPLWLGYVLLFGVLGGVVTLVTGAGIMLFGVLQWFIGDPGNASAASHFDFVPGAAAAMSVGAASRWYHRSILGDRQTRARTEVDRIYDYLLSGAGLLVAAGGLATLIAVVLDGIGGAEIASSTTGDAVAVAITLLAVGVPLWWRFWSIIRSALRDDPQAEVQSITRRIYLFLLFGATGIVAVVGLMITVFVFFEDLLEGTLGAATISSVAVPVALLLTAGAVAWYHFMVFREDRGITVEEEQRPVVREVIVVGGADLVAMIASGTTARVQRIGSADHPTDVATIDEVVSLLATETHERVVVVASNGHFELFPIEV